MPTPRDYYYAPDLKLITMYTHYESIVALTDMMTPTRPQPMTDRDPGDENGEESPDPLTDKVRQGILDRMTPTAPRTVPIVRDADRLTTDEPKPVTPPSWWDDIIIRLPRLDMNNPQTTIWGIIKAVLIGVGGVSGTQAADIPEGQTLFFYILTGLMVIVEVVKSLKTKDATPTS